MNTKKVVKSLSIGLCVLTLTGCGATNKAESDNKGNKTNAASTQNNNDTGNSSRDNPLESANMLGSVVDFTDTGCTAAQQEDIEGGKGAKIVAPGNENADTNVNIKYGSDCVFQIAKIDISTGNTTLSNATVSDIKKQTSIAVYGSFEGKHNLTATEVIIIRFN